MFFQAVNVSLDRVADVGYRFLPRFALRNTSWQRGAFGHKHAVLIRLNRYSEFHANESNAFPKGRKRVAMGSNRRSLGGSVATLQELSDMLGRGFWLHRSPVCSSIAYKRR